MPLCLIHVYVIYFASFMSMIKVPFTPTSFPDYFREKIISISKLSAFQQVFGHVISMFTITQSGVWVGLLVMSLREPG